MSAVVELSHVAKSYMRGKQPVPALRDVSLQVAAQEWVALVGPSGCGKTTCLNVIAGVDKVDTGTVTVCGTDLTHANEQALVDLRRNSVGVIFQAFHLMPHLTVEENVALPLALAGRRDDDRVAHVLQRVGLGHRLKHYPAELSGGEQQRSAIARAIAPRPRLLLADEPTGNLDSASGSAVLELIHELRMSEQTALLMVTHDMSVAQRADRIVHMCDGAIEAETASPAGVA